jgi:hypothetical protein
MLLLLLLLLDDEAKGNERNGVRGWRVVEGEAVLLYFLKTPIHSLTLI